MGQYRLTVFALGKTVSQVDSQPKGIGDVVSESGNNLEIPSSQGDSQPTPSQNGISSGQ
jgi:hypothetical protein